MNGRTALLLVSAALLPAVAGAQPGAPPTLTISLDQALERAAAASQRVIEARARQDAAGAVVGERHAPALPQLSLLGGYTRTNHVDEFGILLPNNQLKIIYPDIPDNYRARVDLQWSIYTAGRQSALEEAARRDGSAAARDVDTTVSDLRLDVTRAFWDVLTTAEAVRVVNESVARMAAHVRDVRAQLDAGLVPPSDLLTAQAQEARQRMLAVQAESTHAVAEAQLARLIDAAPETMIVADAPLVAPPGAAPLDTLVAGARDHRADRQALAERVAAARARERAAGAASRPTAAVVGGVDYARPNPRIFPRVGEWRESWDAGVNVAWPLFDGGRANSELAEATASRRAIEARLADLDSLIALDVRQRAAELESGRAAVDAADVAVRAAAEARRVIGDRFAAGVASSTDVVDAQVALLQAELDRTQAIASARVAEARLAHAAGR